MELPRTSIRKGSDVVGTNDGVWKHHRGLTYAEQDPDNIEMPKARLIKKGIGMKNPFSAKKEATKAVTEDRPVVEEEDSTPVENLSEDAYAVRKVCKLYKAGILNTETVASKITGLIRKVYVLDLKRQGNSFSLEELSYMDKLIFNLVYNGIESILLYGKDPDIDDMIISTIRDQSQLMDYYFDNLFYMAIEEILKEVK